MTDKVKILCIACQKQNVVRPKDNIPSYVLCASCTIDTNLSVVREKMEAEPDRVFPVYHCLKHPQKSRKNCIYCDASKKFKKSKLYKESKKK